ncbi:MAG: TolC family protein [Bacteroidales bacterium]|nr:TolC family protein [Bacteroidales bacterium]
MKKQILLLGFLVGAVIPLWSQNLQPVSLQECLQKAVENFPKEKQLQYNQQTYQLKEEILNKNYLPSLNLNGQASHQSDVTSISIPLPGVNIPTISKNMYKMNLDLQQLIWDGGMTSSQKKLENNSYQISDQQVKISTYQQKQRVAILYFNILFQQQNLKVLHVLLQDLNARITDAQAGLANGAILASDVDVLKVSQMQTQQAIIENQEDTKGLLDEMDELTGIKIQSANQLKTPEFEETQFPFENNRPEFRLLTLQQNNIKDLKKIYTAKRMPTLAAFGQAGYGRPGYNMLNNDFKTYYMFGVQLHWNIFDWNHVKKEKQVLSIQKNILQTEKETFDQNLRVEYKKQLAAIEKYQKLVNTDQQIVNLQDQVVTTSQTKLKNGTITPADYLIQLNKKIKAMLTMDAHHLQLLFTKYQYLTAIGNL